jgi:OmpA-OmpF porin, OOP family
MRKPVQRAVASYVRGLQLAALVSTVCAAGAAEAADKVLLPTQYFNYGISYSMPDDPIDYGIGFDLGYGRSFSPKNWIEGKLSLGVLETGSDTLPDFYQTTLGADYVRSLGNEGIGHFFMLAGGGLSMNDVSPDSEDGSSYYLNAGVGYRTRVSTVWGVRPRVELRYVHDSVLDGLDALQLAFKLEIPPNRQSVVEKTVEVEKIVEVPVEVEKIVEKEVTCVIPPTETPTADTDGDGVADGADRCPGTLKGAKVDASGCVVEEQKISLPNIEFESGKTVLARGGKDKLEAVVEFLANQTEVQVDVFGHTDAQGKDSYNQMLSEGRAKAVVEYLVSRGIDAKRLSSKGFGESQPIASNETADGRAQNRRVELLLRTKK